ncbi:SDR family oxidoreductase [Patulibacter brassicae]|uniref:SDR family oxidoreductase n=1 Tax=Patulibacter brassicae TaxID=1705717 RepID=A0ABU4VLH2_9ACTN|nr:SDR family oxidoreductase [Patulibacter brassicae]MDX8151939.1 SDR family oxidoreductase [Patulibacter brassicae]
MTTFAGRTSLITGAASGIGRAAALTVARRGGALVLTDRSADALEETVAQVTQAGGHVVAHEAFDITDHDAVMAFAERVHATHGAVHVVMNIAGISTWGTVETLEHEHWKAMLDVNLLGPISVIEAFVPAMIRAGRGGHLVNVSSAAGLFGLPWHAAYSASKFGLRGVSEVLRFDLRQHGIHVSLVCPGAVATGLVETVNIVGVDRDDPRVRREVGRFVHHAVSPEKAAAAIVRGVERNRFMVYTSRDIQLGFLGQRLFPWGYALVMRLASRRFNAVFGRARV